MIDEDLVEPAPGSVDNKHYWVLKILDDNLRRAKNNKSILSLPLKLPMICPPKEYSEKSLGGYRGS